MDFSLIDIELTEVQEKILLIRASVLENRDALDRADKLCTDIEYLTHINERLSREIEEKEAVIQTLMVANDGLRNLVARKGL